MKNSMLDFRHWFDDGDGIPRRANRAAGQNCQGPGRDVAFAMNAASGRSPIFSEAWREWGHGRRPRIVTLARTSSQTKYYCARRWKARRSGTDRSYIETKINSMTGAYPGTVLVAPFHQFTRTAYVPETIGLFNLESCPPGGEKRLLVCRWNRRSVGALPLRRGGGLIEIFVI